MAIRLRWRWSRGFLTSLVAALLLVEVVAGMAPAAHAAPSRSINQVRAQVRDLQDKAEAATEKYNEAADQLAGVQARLDVLQSRLARQRRDLAAENATLAALARAAYTGGAIDPTLQVLLSEDPAQFLQQAATLQRVSASQAAALRRMQTARLRLAQTQAEVADKERIAQGYRNSMAANKREADAQLAAARAVLASLVASERRRLAALEAAERRASSSAARRAKAQLLAQLGRNASSMSPRAVTAVKYALGQVGDRYVAAAAGPSSFDCSGLTLAAWRQAGISLPHYSYSQFGRTRRISLSQARPGDLLFFFKGGTHHVAMYIGNGRMVHAANPSSGVIVSSVYERWYAQRFSGVGRVA